MNPPPHRYPPAYPRKSDPPPSVPLPLHPDPVQSFPPTHDAEHERFSFGRHPFFDEMPHEDATHPPLHAHTTADSNDATGALSGVDSLHAPLAISSVPAIPNLSLPNMPQPHSAPSPMPTVVMTPSTMGNAAIVGGASEIVEALSVERKCAPRRLRPMSRSRAQQMTEVQRKQRHNEHTRASRSRIDRGLERLKSVIKKVRPHQKVTKKADVLQEAVKLLKEGFRLPPTESDEERDDAPGSTLTV